MGIVAFLTDFFRPFKIISGSKAPERNSLSLPSEEPTAEQLQAIYLLQKGWQAFCQYPERAIREAEAPLGHYFLQGNGVLTVYWCQNPQCCPQLEIAHYRFDESMELEIVPGNNPWLAVAHSFEALLKQETDLRALFLHYRRRMRQ